ncbi:uncharacterized protein LOC115980926 [Quercus lobata]|uniref:uncharacterized protein LOC115980926 n=1 Tax=Quercus lobata TaxID=97700 RepID=UPI001248E1FE|nr:uncharacterized protein LOC115980926 [Quercus lobata]
MYNFSDFISCNGLLDIPLEGGNFSWSNSLSGSRIDRFLFSLEWEEHYLNIHQKRLGRVLSDHFPISLEGGDIRKGHRPFRFENKWLQGDDFVENVKNWWDSYHFLGTPSYKFAMKLKALKGDLKSGMKLKERVSLSDDEKRDKERIRLEIKRMALLEEISWRQKSRVLWLKEGESNMKFFHQIANSNRGNSIGSLIFCGVLTSDQEVIEEGIVRFYKSFYSENKHIRPHSDVLNFSKISEDKASWLERPFEEAEIFRVVMDFDGDKALGPDGFPTAFF